MDVELAAGSPVIKDMASATEVLESVDMNDDKKIDKVDFTALIDQDILVALKK